MAKKTPSRKGNNRPKQNRTAPKGRVVKTSATKEKTKAVEPKTPSKRTKTPEKEVQLPFGKQNYLLLLLGVGIIGLGFFLMSLDDFVDAREFSISLYIAPVVVVAGFLEIIYAIMYRPQPTASAPSNE
ncbi:MAG: DUF3098 domain-containing protein [Bacteroidota bacterium]